MTGPQVTVLMPCRDAYVFLGDALESVFAQTSSEWNLDVVDDHSRRPETLAELRRLSERGDPRVRVLPSEGRLITGALNTGLRRARTPFVAPLHCDDLLDPEAIEVLTRAIEANPEVDFFHSARRFVDEHGELIATHAPPRTIGPEDFLERGPVKRIQCFRVAKALEIGGMDEELGLHGADDYDFPWRMLEAGAVFLALEECLYAIRDHREEPRLTTHVPLDTQVRELETILRKHGIPEETIRETVARRVDGYMRQALYADDDDRRRKELAGFDPRTGWREPHD